MMGMGCIGWSTIALVLGSMVAVAVAVANRYTTRLLREELDESRIREAAARDALHQLTLAVVNKLGGDRIDDVIDAVDAPQDDV